MANIERKELLNTQDSFITGAGSIARWIKGNPVRFASAVIAVIVVAGGISGFFYWKTLNESKALSKYTNAQNDEKVIKDIASKYSHTKAGKLSLLKLAELSFEKGNYKDAIKNSDEFIQRWGNNDILYYQGLMLKAISHMELKDHDKAIEDLDKCINSDSDLIRQQAMFYKATELNASGSKAQAVELLKKLSAEQPKAAGKKKSDILKPESDLSEYQELAKSALSQINLAGGKVVNAE
jgi:tetratricopeptide (TPR) repeat protein